MKVRVFVPRWPDPAGRPSFSGTDHTFPVMPSIGHVLHFSDENYGDFTVLKVGFVQDGDAFLAAIWLEPHATAPTYCPEPAIEGEPQDRHRDLNHDVPPDSMTTY